MGKNKLRRFAENTTFPHVFQPTFDDLEKHGFAYKGRWKEFFRNNHPITLELGCGKGEYTIGLAQMKPERNYIGLDIKGARFWKGAKQAQEYGLKNVAFVRTRIDQIHRFFDTMDGVDEIWITFPDPQPRESKKKKRLTSPPFLNRYRQFANPGTTVHLKTDSIELFEYTLEVIQSEALSVQIISRDVYTDFPDDPVLGIRTFYETMWLKEGKKIHYIKFILQ
jgi:tRNA (guanine-N7-)-methyltransferase